jgi:predicted secreted protein
MRWPTALLVYAIIWWLVVFMVLPWGNQPIDAADVAKGQAAGAPKKPRILLKFGITTVIAGVIFAIVYWVHDAGLIRIRL